MPQVGILSGIYGDATSDFVVSLPINREPVILDTGLSKGYLRPAPGITAFGTNAGVGEDRGGIVWNGVCYRVIGPNLYRIDEAGAKTLLGFVGYAPGPAKLVYSFDYLAIASANNLYLWNGTALVQVTDPDLGVVKDVTFIAGYFMTTDGVSIVVTELNDPFAVNPLKYGSAELDPDPVVGVLELRGEAIIIGLKTVQVLQNIGGNGFPFANVASAAIERGAVGRDAVALYLETFAFVGSGQNESPGVYIGGAGTSDKLSSREVDLALAALSEAELATVILESRVERDEQRLVLHLPDVSYMFYQRASKLAGVPIWTRLASGIGADEPYRGRGAVLFNGRYVVGDEAGNLGYLDYSVSTHFGDVAGWQFDTALIANPDGRAIVNSTTLVGILGAAAFGADPVVFRSWTIDGRTWSQERAAKSGRAGQRGKMLQWRGGVRVDDWIGFRFRGADAGMATFASLNLDVQALGG